MNRTKFVRAVALFLAVLMIGSVFLVAFRAFALSPDTMNTIPMTGQSSTGKIMIIVGVVAVVILGASLVPVFIKKK